MCNKKGNKRGLEEQKYMKYMKNKEHNRRCKFKHFNDYVKYEWTEHSN